MSEHDGGKNFAIGFLLGALVGAGIALLYAPQSGSETRAMLKEKVDVAREKARDIVDEAKDKAGDIIANAKEQAESIKKAAKK